VDIESVPIRQSERESERRECQAELMCATVSGRHTGAHLSHHPIIASYPTLYSFWYGSVVQYSGDVRVESHSPSCRLSLSSSLIRGCDTFPFPCRLGLRFGIIIIDCTTSTDFVFESVLRSFIIDAVDSSCTFALKLKSAPRTRCTLYEY
jgi:hypothetical protein